MNDRDLSRLLRWYPSTWRDRYEGEIVVFMKDAYGDRPPPRRERLSLAVGGLRERAEQSGLTGDSAPVADRVRSGALLVAAAWAAFVLAGASFAKLSEHFDNALPGGLYNPTPPGSAHHVPDLAYTLVQTVASVAAIAFVVGIALGVPAFVRFLRAGGWASLRLHVLRAVAASELTIATFVPLLIWAHNLTGQQRNGGMPQYGALVLGWAALMAVSLGLWTVAFVAVARRIEISRRLLVAESALAVALTAAMLVMLAAIAVWWASMAGTAPRFLAAGPGSAPVNPQLAATVALMVLSGALAVSGTVRIARSLPLLRRR
jgi:hypothetical protein